ncbi:MAG: flagellar hook-basal body complex protein [Selenomonadaceae bacterium]|nr:flagellar hook-basal body complex protein [Selenomonadaceae bacterium]
MMRSLFSGVSGIKVHQTRMDVIGNNIANINTIGFKGSRTTFSDMLSQMQSAATAPTDSRGGINPRQIGLGVNVASIDLIFTDSSPQSTGRNTDLALSGNGLFYLKDGNQAYYTRNGSFLFDEEGHYVMAGNGFRVQGWNAIDGQLNTNGATTDIIVPVGKTMKAEETTSINYSGNLDKEDKIIESITFTKATGDEADARLVATGTVDDEHKTVTDVTSVNVDGINVVAATITFKDGSTVNVTSGYYEVGKTKPITTLATIYDSLGGRHEVTVLIDKDPDSTGGNADPTDQKAKDTGTEKYSYTTEVGGQEVTYPVTKNVDATTGAVTYTYIDADGNSQTVAESDVTTTMVYDNRWRAYIAPGVGEKGPADASFANSYTRKEEDGTMATGKMDKVAYIYFDDRGSFVSNGTDTDSSITFSYSEGNGAASNQAVIDFSKLTQYANSTTSFPSTNGHAAGVLQSVSVDNEGVVSGTYTNGIIQEEAQIAVAQFTNSSGLTKVGSTIYAESNNSGEANIKRVSDFGMSVTSSALEMSNVDLATEFSEMIITQRGFQANSKMTTVSDEMLETLINMKR